MDWRLPRRALTLAAACLLCACGARPEVDLRARGEYLCREARYDEAAAVLKARLLEQPDDAGAHFLLGRCYLLSASPWYGLAQGEFETALQLFYRQGKRNPISYFSGPEYFEFICHVEQAKICLKQVLLLSQVKAPRAALAQVLEQCQSHYEKARALLPDSEDTRQLETLISEMRRALDAGELQGPGASR